MIPKDFTIQIIAVWLISLIGALILKSAIIFVAPVAATLILSVVDKMDR